MINYATKRAAADRIIRRWGAPAKLRSSAGDRDCVAVEVEISAAERRALSSPSNRVILISAVGLDSMPNKNKESLVLLNKETLTEIAVLKIVRDPIALAPGGVNIHWEIEGETRSVG